MICIGLWDVSYYQAFGIYGDKTLSGLPWQALLSVHLCLLPGILKGMRKRHSSDALITHQAPGSLNNRIRFGGKRYFPKIGDPNIDPNIL